MGRGRHSFLALSALPAFALFPPSKLAFALSSNPSFRQSLAVDLTFRRDLSPLLALGSKSDLRFHNKQLPPLVLKVPCYWLFVQGFHRLLGGLQFTLAIVKLGSTLYMANWQRGSSGLLATPTWFVQSPNFAIKVTSVKIQHSSFTSGASAPYFGC